ncbi:glycoside hydrolase family 19 protein [Chromobacterium amazonense]|uniref:glycoside hydrolase family 19 protein n=1 Tax=Chromobacterium amazonense TaxID=1382803 RepID=UPI0031F5F396
MSKKQPNQAAANNKAVLINAMLQAGIHDPKEQAMFLAQTAHESWDFSHMHEGNYRNASNLLSTFKNRLKAQGITTEQQAQALINSGQEKVYDAIYGGRMGNKNPGDGIKYRGRGFVQLTGHDQYAAAGKALKLDLINHPELAEDPSNAAKIAVWYWQNHKGLAEAGRAGNVKQATQIINGGQNGYAERKAKYEQYLKQGPIQAPSATAPAQSAPVLPGPNQHVDVVQPSAHTPLPQAKPQAKKTAALAATPVQSAPAHTPQRQGKSQAKKTAARAATPVKSAPAHPDHTQHVDTVQPAAHTLLSQANPQAKEAAARGTTPVQSAPAHPAPTQHINVVQPAAHTLPPQDNSQAKKTAAPAPAQPSAQASQVEPNAILAQRTRFNGYRYKLGGNGEKDAKGVNRIDCSHLVNQAVKGAGYAIPYQTTADMAHSEYYEEVDPKDVKPGDIALWQGDKNHTGIVENYDAKTGKGNFFGAQSTKGASSAKLGSGYWKAPQKFLRPKAEYLKSSPAMPAQVQPQAGADAPKPAVPKPATPQPIAPKAPIRQNTAPDKVQAGKIAVSGAVDPKHASLTPVAAPATQGAKTPAPAATALPKPAIPAKSPQAMPKPAAAPKKSAPTGQVAPALGNTAESQLSALIAQLSTALAQLAQPIRVVVDVQNGNIVAAVNAANSQQQRRN